MASIWQKLFSFYKVIIKYLGNKKFWYKLQDILVVHIQHQNLRLQSIHIWICHFLSQYSLMDLRNHLGKNHGLEYISQKLKLPRTEKSNSVLTDPSLMQCHNNVQLTCFSSTNKTIWIFEIVCILTLLNWYINMSGSIL